MSLRSSQPTIEAPEPSQVFAPLARVAGAFDFLLLLYDIRMRVYKILLVNDDREISLTPDEAYPHTIDEHGLPFPQIPHKSTGQRIPRNLPSNINILYTCKTTSVEVTRVLYGQNRFLICTYWSSAGLLKLGGPRSLGHLRKQRISIHSLGDATDRRGHLSTWNVILRHCPNLKTILLTTCSSMWESHFFAGVLCLAYSIAKTQENSSSPKLVVRARMKDSPKYRWVLGGPGYSPEAFMEMKTHQRVIMPSIEGCEIVYTGCMSLRSLTMLATYKKDAWNFEPNNMDKEIRDIGVGDLVELKWVEHVGKDRADVRDMGLDFTRTDPTNGDDCHEAISVEP